ncbi:MAG TPA: hypothetical protein VEW65_10280 [Chryseolinea sp.]|nr:hypothetical protein [Chryseolinea sp.]
MSIAELAAYIRQHKNGNVPYPYGDEFIVAHHIRTVWYQHNHITNDHILECCRKAVSYDEFVELCRPLAKSDTEKFIREKNKAAAKGRTRRRFK